jgi:hypothetical protein
MCPALINPGPGWSQLFTIGDRDRGPGPAPVSSPVKIYFQVHEGRCLWCWISSSPTTVSEVALTLVLTDTYITLMIWINHSLRLPLTRSESIELTTIITPRHRSLLNLLLLVRLGDYIVNSWLTFILTGSSGN